MLCSQRKNAYISKYQTIPNHITHIHPCNNHKLLLPISMSISYQSNVDVLFCFVAVALFHSMQKITNRACDVHMWFWCFSWCTKDKWFLPIDNNSNHIFIVDSKKANLLIIIMGWFADCVSQAFDSVSLLSKPMGNQP